MNDLGHSTRPPARRNPRRRLTSLDALLASALAVALGVLLMGQLRPGGIASLVGRYGRMTAEEEQLEARLQAARHTALAHVVLQLDHEPGLEPLVWPDSSVPWGHVPDLTLFDDGQVVYLDEALGDTAVPYATQLPPEAAQRLVDDVLARGFERLRSQESQSGTTADGQPRSVTDGGYENLRLRRDGTLTSLRIYDDAELTSDPEAFRAVVDYLRGWTTPEAVVFAPGTAVLYPMDPAGDARPVIRTPLEVRLAAAADPDRPLDWPATVAAPDVLPTFVNGDALAALRDHLPAATGPADELATGYPGPDGAVADATSAGTTGADATSAGTAEAADQSDFWGWTFRVPRPDGSVREMRLVAVPWIYGDRYPDAAADLADIEDATAAVVAARAAARTTAVALQAQATAEAALAPPATATPEVGSEEPRTFPFPPQVRPGRLDFALGIQTWNQWLSDPAPLFAVKLETSPRFVWLKQRFAWADLQPAGSEPPEQSSEMWRPDAWLDAAKASSPDYPSARVLIQLDVPPAWAKRDGDVPFDLEAWERFVHEFARRFAGRVDAYEILNEPNLAREWGGPPNPAAYARVLATAFRAIKTADPLAIVVSAGLAPTGTQLPEAMGDDEFLRRLYDAIAAEGGSSDLYFDALGAHAPGYAADPTVAPDEAAADTALGGQRYFTFRRVEDLRRIMVQRGDDYKQIVVTEFGWTIDTRPDSPYTWFATTAADRATRIRAARDFARDHWAPWIGPLILFTAMDPAWTPGHEAWWWSVTGRDGTLRPEIRAVFAGE